MSLPDIFFVRGGWKFGTTWLERILDQHPAIICSGEYHFEKLDRGLDALRTTPHAIFNTRGLFDDFQRDYEHLITNYLRMSALALRTGVVSQAVVLIGDRTPEPILPLTVRGVPYVVILRDGRDVIVSGTYHALNTMVKKNRKPGPGGPVKVFDRYLDDPNYFIEKPEKLLVDEPFVRRLARNWSDVASRNLDGLDLQKEGRLQAPAHFVKYEDLRADPESIRKDLFEFLGVDPEAAPPLEGPTAPGAAVEDPTKFIRKGIVGDHVRYFTPQVSEWFDDEAGKTMRRAGYTG